MKKTWKINPEWVKYNNLHNEGGEGYNPHTKWLNNMPGYDAVTGQPEVKVERDPVMDKLVKDTVKDGNVYHLREILERYEQDVARLPKLTDAIAIKQTEAAIAKRRVILEENGAFQNQNAQRQS